MIGIDLLEIKRMEKFVQDERFLNKILSPSEREAYDNKPSAKKLAVYFSAKEAMAKAVGTGFGPYAITDFQLHYKKSGQPFGLIPKNGTHFSISVSHDGGFVTVIAQCVEKQVQVPKAPATIPIREKDAHKGTMGRCVLIGGSEGMVGSVTLASLATLRSGAGYSYVLTRKEITSLLQIKCIEPIIHSFEKGAHLIEKADSIVIGPGMSCDQKSEAYFKETLEKAKAPIVIDADGLNLLASDLDLLKMTKQPCILTPHRGELERLLGPHPTEEKILTFVKKYDILLVVKGNQTKVYNESMRYVNETGNPGMATAGSGDVLSGIIGGFLARGLQPKDAATLGVYIHGLAGDLAAKHFGQESLIASDILQNIGEAIKVGGVNDERGKYLG